MCHHATRATIELPEGPEAPSIAREFIAATACPGQSEALLQNAVLLTSEAITNAVVHGAPPVILAVDCSATALEVRIRDASPRHPRVRDPKPLEGGGRGVRLIDVLADCWGVEDIRGDGKEVWFRLNAGPTAGPKAF
jgi:anti-sigma regulatory factor (Ser/Thr protein kinase)